MICIHVYANKNINFDVNGVINLFKKLTKSHWYKSKNYLKSGRLHVYTYLVVLNADKKTNVWNELKKIPGLKFEIDARTKKWKEVSKQPTVPDFTKNINSNDCWHLRQNKWYAVDCEDKWLSLFAEQKDDFKLSAQIEKTNRSVTQTKITESPKKDNKLNPAKIVLLSKKELEDLYNKLSEDIQACIEKSAGVISYTESETVEKEYSDTLDTEEDKTLYYLALLIEKKLLTLFNFGNPEETGIGLEVWLKTLESNQTIQIDTKNELKSWTLVVSGLLYTLYRKLVYTYQEKYLSVKKPDVTLTYITKTLQSSIKTINTYMTNGAIPEELHTAFTKLSSHFQSTINLINSEKQKIQTGEPVNYFTK